MKRVLFLLGVVLVMSFGMAYSNPSSNWQANQPTFDNLYAGDYSNYWPILQDMEDGQCNATTDFVIGIPPGGCSPSVVTSDLLAEQNVPVFCELYAIKVNPLIKVSAIKSISFKGDYPEGVRSIVYHPARAAVKSYSTLLGSPTLENIGYVVIILKQEKVEANITEWISGNLTATMTYDAEEAYGVGRSEFYLEPTGEDEWQSNFMASSFWNGRGFLKVLDVADGKAKIQVMGSKDNVLRTLTLKEGETSSSSYLPGFYCKAGLKVKLTDITTQEDMARLNVDGNDIWVRKGSKFLDGKCGVKSLDIRGNNDGEIRISCSGAGTIKPLILRGDVVRLRDAVGDVEDYNIGDKFGMDYVVAYGKLLKENRSFVVLADKMPESEVLVKIENLRKSSEAFWEFVENVKKLKDISGAEVIADNEKDKFVGMGIEIKDSADVDIYFDESVDVTVDELIAEYPREEKDNGDTWAEEALYEEIVLAGERGKFATQKDLMDLFLEEYPLATTEPYVREMRAKLDGTDYSDSFASVYVGNEFKTISVVDFKPVEEGEKSVDLKVGTQRYEGRNESDEFDIGNDKVEVLDISPGKVKLRLTSKDKDVRMKSPWIKEGESEKYNGREIYVTGINVKQVAHISLIPDVEHEKSEADFTFAIGVEKRAIELSPEKTERMLKNLNASIKKWEDIVERLGDVVTGLKGACFATSTVLMIKSMATGASGTAAARSKVMSEYKEICDTQYKDKTHTECYNDLSKEIATDVAGMTAVMTGVNAKMKSVQESNTGDSGGLFGGEGIVDQEKYQTDLKAQIDSDPISVKVGAESIPVPVSELYSVAQIRSVMAWEEAKKSGGNVEAVAKAEMDDALRNVALGVQANKANSDAQAEIAAANLGDLTVQSYVSKDAVLLKWDGKTDDVTKKKIQGLNYNGKIYKLFLDGVSGGNLGVVEAHVFTQPVSKWEQVKPLPKEFEKLVFSAVASSGECSNVWPEGKAQVSYYESGDNKGLPAIVPFDLKDGWYAMVSNSGGTFIDDSPQGYTANADVQYFKICNIGSNKVMQTGSGDDLCQSFDANSAGTVKDFIPCPKMNSAEVTKIYGKAREAIKSAASQYGESQVNIFDEMIGVGAPMGSVGGFECQDFMSPEDCKMMFNVCDPVICPPSRCDFGGKFPVSDVIATGIIGSLVLCLPNAKEGILMPICISGVQAGLDTYVSILKSEKDCLQHSLDTGEMVGICDEITSIYKCEFFWRQMAPLMDQLIPGVIEYAVSGSRVRGGGEYALVNQAWSSTKKSIDYFKDVYAQNAFKVFNIRSTQEVGSAVCKSFVGTSVPGSASFIENLLEPESPSQFYAHFSQKTFSEATAPVTAQYKVYYHIYAGNDQGAQYKVYLKNPPATSYYASNPEIAVKSGFIAAGDSADESIDFTAPEGYKELCVVINAQEECGFKEVTSSFALDFISKSYAEEQANDMDITTESECISGSPSALSMASLNIQSGAEEVLNPEIALRGIVRVCASANPDAGVVSQGWVSCEEKKDCGNGFNCSSAGWCESLSESGVMQKTGGRWKDVGYCGDSSLRCWLDVDSVADDLEAIESLTGESSKILDERRGLIESTRLDLEGVRALLDSARIDIGALLPEDLKVVGEGISKSSSGLFVMPKVLGILDELDKVIGTSDSSGAGTNGDRAEALALEASVWRLLVGEAAEGEVEKAEEAWEFGGDWEVNMEEDVEFEGDYAEGTTESDGDVDVDADGVSCELFCRVSGYDENSVGMTEGECGRNDGAFNDAVEGGCCCSASDEIKLDWIAEECVECGGPFFDLNRCDAEECLAVGYKIGKDCEFSLWGGCQDNLEFEGKDCSLECAAAGDQFSGSSSNVVTCESRGGSLQSNDECCCFGRDDGETCNEDTCFNAMNEREISDFGWVKDITDERSCESIRGEFTYYDSDEECCCYEEVELTCEFYCSGSGFDIADLSLTGFECMDMTDGIFKSEIEEGCCCYNDNFIGGIANIFKKKDCSAVCGDREVLDAKEAADCGSSNIFLSECCCSGNEIEEPVKNLDDVLKENGWSRCGQYMDDIKKYSDLEGIDDWRRVLAIMIQESGCQYDAVSGSGSYGLMQIEGGSFEDICADRLSSGNDDFVSMRINSDKTEQNIECGVKILKKKYNDYDQGVLDSWAWKTAPSQGGFGNEVRACIETTEVKYSEYENWEAAERGYNGWGCGAGADVDYVEKVEGILDKLEGVSFEDVSSRVIEDDNGQIEILESSGDVCPIIDVSEGVSLSLSASERVLKVAEEMDGELVVDKANCFEAVDYIYAKAGVVKGSNSNCFSIAEGVSLRSGMEESSYSSGQLFTVGKSCSRFSVVEDTKLDGISPGDMLSIVYEKSSGNLIGHNVIFVSWYDEKARLARVFDWTGTNDDGKRVYQYVGYDLSDSDNGVYMSWKPVLKNGEVVEKVVEENNEDTYTIACNKLEGIFVDEIRCESDGVKALSSEADFPAGKVCCDYDKVIKELDTTEDDEDLEVYDVGIFDGFRRIGIVFMDGKNYFVEYRWGEKGVESKIEKSGLFGIGRVSVCGWSSSCFISTDVGEFESQMHRDIMSKSSWAYAVGFVRSHEAMYKEDRDFSVDYYVL